MQHLSTYALTFEDGTPLERARQAGQLEAMDEQMDRRMYEVAMERLHEAGFDQYEVSNFARPGLACQHNLGYWLNRPFIGIGPSAGSYWQGSRTLNRPDIHEYMAAIETGRDAIAEIVVPTQPDQVCETAVLNLRMRDGIRLERFVARTGYDALEVFAEPIRFHQGLGLIRVDRDAVRLTAEALPIADSVLCDFASLDAAPCLRSV